MKALIVYSSLTGNTKQIAEAIFSVMPEGSRLADVKDNPSTEGFDFVGLGFWADKGYPDTKMLNYMETVTGKNVGLFGTLGAWPDSDHAKDFMQRGVDKVKESNTYLGYFVCQGKVDPRLLAAMEKMPEAKQAHPMTEARRARIEEAKKHPDDRDCENARACFADMLKKLEGDS